MEHFHCNCNRFAHFSDFIHILYTTILTYLPQGKISTIKINGTINNFSCEPHHQSLNTGKQSEPDINKDNQYIKIEYHGQIYNKLEKIFNQKDYKLAHSSNKNKLLKPKPPNSLMGPIYNETRIYKVPCKDWTNRSLIDCRFN